MFFIPENSYTPGFKFRQLYPNKEPFISQGLAGKPHLGYDALCNGIQGTATLDGIGSYVYGPQGGHQLIFTPNGRNHKIRFLHLKQKPKVGQIKVGDKVFITGNSGEATNAPHLHSDIFDNTIQDYVDPQLYNWAMTMTSKAIIYRKSIQNPDIITQGLLILDQKIQEKTGGEFNLITEIADTNQNFTTITYPNNQIGVDPEQILTLDPNESRVTCLVHSGIQPQPTNPFHSPITSNGSTPIQIPENWYVTFPEVFAQFYLHELLHAWYYIINHLPLAEQVKKVHEPGPDWGGYGNPMDYYLSLLIELKPHWAKLSVLQGEPMIIIHKKSDANTKFVLTSDIKIGFATFTAFQKHTQGRPIVDLALDDVEFAKIPTSTAVIKD
jgi:hypothetical protein